MASSPQAVPWHIKKDHHPGRSHNYFKARHQGRRSPEDGKLVCEAFAEEKSVGGEVGGKAMRNSTEADQGKISSGHFEKVLGGRVVIRNENHHFLIYFVL